MATRKLVAGGSRARAAALLKALWPGLALFLLAAVAAGAGFYVRSGPAWLERPAIREYNAGVAAYQELLWAPLITSQESLLSVYPHVVEKAGERFEVAGGDGSGGRVKTAALYNLGTLIGRVAFFPERLPGVDVSVAVTRLSEALREDPTDEDARFNLELLLTRLTRDKIDGAASGQGYSAGAVDKGY